MGMSKEAAIFVVGQMGDPPLLSLSPLTLQTPSLEAWVSPFVCVFPLGFLVLIGESCQGASL